MEQEEKSLLIRDLCARFPYGVQTLEDLDKKFDGGVVGELAAIVPYTGKKYNIQGPLFYQKGSMTPVTIEEIRPYLRPMSSMTEAERTIYEDLIYCDGYTKFDTYDKVVDWLNSNHFDYRGLIPMGLALEAPDGMYKTE